MKIGLVDVDSHNFPNLCLVKLSAWHKERGDDVEFSIPLLPYDRIYRLRELDYTPYLMIYNKPSAPKELLRMQRWVNNKIIWRSVERFENFDIKKA